MRARLYLDEDVLAGLARILRSAGYDVISALDVGAVGIEDEDQLARAAAEDRAILSFNTGISSGSAVNGLLLAALTRELSYLIGNTCGATFVF